MHKFLSAIGFSKLNKETLDELIQEIELRPDFHEAAINTEENQFVELGYMVADNIGLVLRGTYDENDVFKMDYYYPTVFSDIESTKGIVDVIKQSDKENYYVMSDEINLGVSLIFQLQNMGAFLRSSHENSKDELKSIKLAALATEGKVLLPIQENEKSKTKAKLKRDKKMDLVEQAKDGNEEAIESLTLDEIDMYSMLSRRIGKEDILSIVKSYFMPFGIENDKYEILGEILEVQSLINHITMEEIYALTINCNDIVFKVAINKKDTLGEPSKGRRFKGNIWLQGTVDFN